MPKSPTTPSPGEPVTWHLFASVAGDPTHLAAMACRVCGALVVDMHAHVAWHARTDA